MKLRVTAAVAALAVPMSPFSPPDRLGRHRLPLRPAFSFTSPTYAGGVPTPTDVLGFELRIAGGHLRRGGDLPSSGRRCQPRCQGRRDGGVRAGPRALVRGGGKPKDVRAAQAAAKALRNPKISKAKAARIAERAPAIAWVASNVHGNEESGTDAALQVLRDLADRTDCAAGKIRDGVVTVIVPTQNPDGRELDYRRNSYGFDLNRDWFARTQPETDGKLQLLRRYPSVLFIDDHEMGADDFFFPPNADPVHHEIADRSISWINDLYGASMIDQFTKQGSRSSTTTSTTCSTWVTATLSRQRASSEPA